MYSSLFDKYSHFTDHYTQDAIDELNPKQQAPYRVYKDSSTTAFNNIFFKTDIQRYRFVDYTFHKIHIDLTTKLDSTLKAYGYEILGGQEQTRFYYKGGNVFHEYFCTEMYDNIVNPQFRESITKNFKISDNDFSIQIIADTYQRFLQIYQGVLKILACSLQELSELFDKLIEDDAYSKSEALGKLIEDDAYSKSEALGKLIEDDSKSSKKVTVITDPSIEESVKQYRWINAKLTKLRYLYQTNNYDAAEIAKMRKHIEHAKTIKTVNLVALVTLYQLLEIWGWYSRENVELPSAEIQRLLQNKKDVFVSNGFYSKAASQDLINGIVSELSQLSGKPFYDADELEYVYVPTDNTRVMLSQAVNSVTYNKNDAWEQIRMIKQGKSYHPITFNDTIHSLNKRGMSDVHFALMRIKLGIRLINGVTVNGKYKDLAIPSELIDVSIPKYVPNYKIQHIKLVQFGNYMSLYTYDIDGMTHDIIRTIFEQRIFVKMDLKYEKRLIRLMSFLYLSCKLRKDMSPYHSLIRLCDSIHKHLTSDVPFDYGTLQPLLVIPCDVLPTLVTDRLNTQLLTVKDQYHDIQPIVTYVVTNMVWLGKSLNHWLSLMNKYRPLNSFVIIPHHRARQYHSAIKQMLVDMTRTIVQVGQAIRHDVLMGGAVTDKLEIQHINHIRFITCANKELPKVHRVNWSINDALCVNT